MFAEALCVCCTRRFQTSEAIKLPLEKGYYGACPECIQRLEEKIREKKHENNLSPRMFGIPR